MECFRSLGSRGWGGPSPGTQNRRAARAEQPDTRPSARLASLRLKNVGWQGLPCWGDEPTGQTCTQSRASSRGRADAICPHGPWTRAWPALGDASSPGKRVREGPRQGLAGRIHPPSSGPRAVCQASALTSLPLSERGQCLRVLGAQEASKGEGAKLKGAKL